MPGAPPILVICGPTAAGKSALAVAVAEHLNTEIINVDSMQVYAGLDVGTGKPTAEELVCVPHHGVGHVPLGTEYSAAAFKADMDPQLDRLLAAGKTPVVCGGSGLYLRALIAGLFPGPPKDADVRAELHARAALLGVPALHAQLAEVDPVTADRLVPNDERRIVRALEVYRLTGEPISVLQAERTAGTARANAHWFGVRRARDDLHDRIAERIARMWDAGWVDEVRGLCAQGLEPVLRRLRPLGYVDILDALYAGTPGALAEARRLTIMHTQQFAKRQGTWFRNQHDVAWLDVEPDGDVTSCYLHVAAAARTA